MGLKLAYFGLSALMVMVLVFGAFHAISKTNASDEEKTKSKRQVLLGFLGFHAYVIGLSISGVLETFELPPRFVVFIILPVFIFTGIFLNKQKNKEWIQQIPTSWLVLVQSFRLIVEIIFVFSITAGILPENVTIEGYNMDMIFAVSAVLVWFAYTRKWIGEQVLLAWNYLGLVVLASIIFVFMTTIFASEAVYGEYIPMSIEFTMWPYNLVAGFLMPSAVFIHVLSIVQLKSRS